MKTCNKCKQNKSYSEFGPSKWADGYRPTCNQCRNSIEAPTYYSSHQHKIKEYRRKNRKKILDYNKKYYQNNPLYFQKYNQTHIQQYQNWRITNKARLNAYRKQLRLSDPNFRIACTLRTRTSTLLRRCKATKSNSTLKLLGCSLEELRRHLTRQFQIGMSWKNYGQWHIDHIVPCASFDLTQPIQQAKCFHFSNLQPLWAIDNLKKNKRA